MGTAAVEVVVGVLGDTVVDSVAADEVVDAGTVPVPCVGTG